MTEAANSDDTTWLEIAVVPLRNDPSQWLVEAIDHQSEGEIYRAIFQGPDAEKRARAYATTLTPPPADGWHREGHDLFTLTPTGWARHLLVRIEGGHMATPGELDALTARVHAALSRPSPQTEEVAQIAELIVRDVCELPDRMSPEDWPEAMLVTGEELHGLVIEHFSPLASQPTTGGDRG